MTEELLPSNLVARLREIAGRTRGRTCSVLCGEALNEIERLAAGIKALQATCCGDDPEKCHGCRALLGLLAAPESRDG